MVYGTDEDFIELDEPHNGARILSMEADESASVFLLGPNDETYASAGSRNGETHRVLYHHFSFEEYYDVIAIQVSGMDATLDSITLSPLSIMVEYTVHQEVPQAERENGLEDGENDPYAPFRDLPIVITYTDGTTLEIDSGNTHIGSGSGRAKCSIGLVFDTIRPLDEVSSVTVGDIVLPVSAGG